MNGKRKRSLLSKHVIKIKDSDDETDSDAALARRLQEEEYAQEVAPNKRPKIEKWAVDDSVEESGLSEAESLSSLDLPLAHMRKAVPSSSANTGKGKAPMLPPPSRGKKTTLPTRVASANARQSFGNKIKFEDNEIWDLDEPSATDSEDDFKEESEDVSTSVSDTESEALVSTRESSVAPTAGRGRLAAANGRAGRLGRAGGASAGVRVRGGHRGRRFGNITQDQGSRIAQQVSDIVHDAMLTRKERERKKLERSHPSIKTMWDVLDATPIIKPVEAAQPASITRRLKPFQLEGLDWMIKQEQTDYKGGLLGDEMGMGKTIQAVSLIMSDYPQKQPTLVVVPPVALMQWSTEITDYTDGKLKVLVYHGHKQQSQAHVSQGLEASTMSS